MKKEILKKFDLTEEEKEFIEKSETGNTSKINFTRIVSNILLSKTIEKNTDKIIESNRKHSNAMKFLTGALVLVGLLQVLSNSGIL